MEERASRFSIGGGASGPSRREASRSSINLTRNIRSGIARTDPHGSNTESRPLLSSFMVQWDFPFSNDTSSLEAVFDHLCDPGTSRIGSPRSILPAEAHAELADGGLLKLEQGILKSFQMAFGERKPLGFQTSWDFGKASVPGSYPAAAAFTGTRAAGPKDCSLAFGSTTAVAFAGSISINRTAIPAGFTEDGDATSYSGPIACDIVGRITARLSSSDGINALRSRFTDSLTFAVTTPAPFTLAIPKATFQVTSRRIVSPNLTDYGLDFLAITEPGSALATVAFI